tara:strand:- start:32 stop:496 length:465 start_codon:yes stop_codon:yes gene_type:complete
VYEYIVKVWKLEEKEELKGVMTRMESGLVTSTYSLYFTNKRIIRALTFSAGKKVGTWAVGGKLLGGTLNKHFENKKDENLRNLNLDEILNENKRNIEIDFSSIKLINMWKTFVGAKITIVTSDKEYSMKIKEKKKFNDYLELIKSLLPDKLEVK